HQSEFVSARIPRTRTERRQRVARGTNGSLRRGNAWRRHLRERESIRSGRPAIGANGPAKIRHTVRFPFLGSVRGTRLICTEANAAVGMSAQLSAVSLAARVL